MDLDSLISKLESAKILRTPAVSNALRNVDRKLFIPEAGRNLAYEDAPLPIGYGQTISQPLTVALMMELLQPRPGELVLDVGSGSGWAAALLGWLVGPQGRVISVERIPQLAASARRSVARAGFKNVEIVVGDASRGWAENGPYDVIHVAAAADSVPSELKSQLKPGGRLIIPIGDPVQDLALITKNSDNTYQERRIPGFQFVPLIGTSA